MSQYPMVVFSVRIQVVTRHLLRLDMFKVIFHSECSGSETQIINNRCFHGIKSIKTFSFNEYILFLPGLASFYGDAFQLFQAAAAFYLLLSSIRGGGLLSFM